MDRHPVMQRFEPALRQLLNLLLVYVGLADDLAHAGQVDGARRAFDAMSDPQSLARRHHRRVCALLRPLESATRRLIVVLAASIPSPRLGARDLRPEIRRVWRRPLAGWQRQTPGVTVPLRVVSPFAPTFSPTPPQRMPRFSLFDPLKRFDRKSRPRRVSFPRVLSPFDSATPPVSPPPRQTPDDPLCDLRVMRRVAALAHALDTLPQQARRFARWKARCSRRLTLRRSPFRPGLPRGSPPRRQPRSGHRDEHIVLGDLNGLAFEASGRADTS